MAALVSQNKIFGFFAPRKKKRNGRSKNRKSTSGIDDGARGGDERLVGWVKDAGAIGARARFGPWSSRKRVKEERAFVVVVVVGGVVRLARARKRRG